MIQSQLFRFVPLILLTIFTGCSKSDFQYAQLYQAKGSLTINGKPAEGAMLIFVPVEPGLLIDERGTRPHAYVDANGEFQVTTYQEGDGIPIGQYRVGLIWENKPNSSSSWDKLQGKYVNPDSTQILVSVQPGENRFPR